MRNIIAMLGLLIVAVTTSALPTNSSDCNYQKCDDLLLGDRSVCETIPEFIQCADTEILKNPACPENIVKETQEIKDDVQHHCQQGTAQMATSALPTNSSDCNYEKCVDLLYGDRSVCQIIPEFIQCADTEIFKNPTCPENVVEETQEIKDTAQHYIKTHCQPETAQTIPEPESAVLSTDEDRGCHFENCLAIIERYGFHCGTVSEILTCAETIILNNTYCPDIVKDITREEIREAEKYLKENCNETSNESEEEPEVTEFGNKYSFASESEPVGCPYETCLRILSGRKVGCWNVPEAILCGEGLILNNPACPEDIQNETRDKIRQGQAFLKERCPFHINGESEKCKVQQCLEGVKTQGVTCQTVAEGIQCADTTILNNPDCDQSVISVVQEESVYATYFLKAYCNRRLNGQEDVEVRY